MRCGNDPNVGSLTAACSPYATNFVAVESAKQLRLSLEGQVTDLVQKQTTALRFGEGALAAYMRAGESTALVAKELGFDELAREGRHVDGDERPQATGSERVE